MRNFNIKMVLRDQKRKLTIIAGVLILILTIFFGFNIYQDIKTEKIKLKMINEQLKKAESELEENKEIIFFNNKSVETKEKKTIVNTELELLRKELDKLQTYDQCIEVQLERLANNKEVDLEYCENFSNEEIPKPKEQPLEIKSISGSQEKENLVDRDEEVILGAMEIIKKYEGVRYTAYWDTKQYSICFGSKSYKGATATHEECEKLLRERVQNELLRINRLADNLDANKKIALISFFYNVWYKYNVLEYAKNGDHKSVSYLISLYNSAGGKYLPWLQKRRNAEIQIYNS